MNGQQPPLFVYFDGSCGPFNPGGTAAYGFVIRNSDNDILKEGFGRVGSGRKMSNNVGEYSGLLKAMLTVSELYPDNAVVYRGDSSLVISQMKGESRAIKGLYLPYYEKAAAIAAPFIARRQWQFEWIPRELNYYADELAQYHRFKVRR